MSRKIWMRLEEVILFALVVFMAIWSIAWEVLYSTR